MHADNAATAGLMRWSFSSFSCPERLAYYIYEGADPNASLRRWGTDGEMGEVARLGIAPRGCGIRRGVDEAEEADERQDTVQDDESHELEKSERRSWRSSHGEHALRTHLGESGRRCHAEKEGNRRREMRKTIETPPPPPLWSTSRTSPRRRRCRSNEHHHHHHHHYYTSSRKRSTTTSNHNISTTNKSSNGKVTILHLLLRSLHPCVHCIRICCSSSYSLDFTQRDEEGWSVLHRVCQITSSRMSWEILRLLLSRAIDSQSKRSNSRNNHKEMVKETKEEEVDHHHHRLAAAAASSPSLPFSAISSSMQKEKEREKEEGRKSIGNSPSASSSLSFTSSCSSSSLTAKEAAAPVPAAATPFPGGIIHKKQTEKEGEEIERRRGMEAVPHQSDQFDFLQLCNVQFAVFPPPSGGKDDEDDLESSLVSSSSSSPLYHSLWMELDFLSLAAEYKKLSLFWPLVCSLPCRSSSKMAKKSKKKKTHGRMMKKKMMFREDEEDEEELENEEEEETSLMRMPQVLKGGRVFRKDWEMLQCWLQAKGQKGIFKRPKCILEE